MEAKDEVEAHPTRLALGMLRPNLRPIDGATRKLQVALEFSRTFTLTNYLTLQRGKFIRSF